MYIIAGRSGRTTTTAVWLWLLLVSAGILLTVPTHTSHAALLMDPAVASTVDHTHGGGHRCIHDEVMRTRGPAVAVVQQYDEDDDVEPRAKTGQKRLLNHGSANQALRIRIDTTYLGDEPAYTCATEGQVVDVGNPGAGGSACNREASTFSNCKLTCLADDLLTSAKRTHIVSLVNQAVTRLSNALKVVPVSGNLTLAGGQYGLVNRFTIPQVYTTTGVPTTDVVIFVTARPTTPGTLAYAGELQKDSRDRPIAGHFNWGPNNLQLNASRDALQLGVAMHEITHALGFSASKFAEFRNWDAGHTQRGLSNVKRTVTRTNPVNAKLYNVEEIILPSVLTKARDHFQCFNNQLTGLQLEDGGGSGTSGSHWERRLFPNEFMAGAAPNKPVFSAITLALLTDSGWYQADYTQAETLAWGNALGCSFVNGYCSQWTQRGYKCDTEGVAECSFDYRTKSVCSVTSFTTALPDRYQHFSGEPRKGGREELADYCPFLVGYANGDCTDLANQDSNLDRYGESFGTQARCFPSTLLNLAGFTINSRPACYTHTCTSTTDLKVRVGGVWHDCTSNTAINVADFGGQLTCPSTSDLCAAGATSNMTFPTITSVSPSSVSAIGGTRITITGTNLGGPSADVKVSVSKQDASIKSRTETQIVATMPKLSSVASTSASANTQGGTRKETVVVTVDDTAVAGPFESLEVKAGTGSDALDELAQFLIELFGDNAVYVYRYWWGGVVLLALIIVVAMYVSKRKKERRAFANQVHPEVQQAERSAKVPRRMQRESTSLVW